MSKYFKLGESVVCVNNQDFESQLTVGKEYEVTDVYPQDSIPWIDITDDRGYPCTGFQQFRFKRSHEELS